MQSVVVKAASWLTLLQWSASLVRAVPVDALDASSAAKTTYTFGELVVFGDELSDNGNGSWAHGIAGGDASIYGFGTWTCGPVAVSYLADMLNIPLYDYAWGGCCGGSSSGATIDNNYLAAEAKWNGSAVPSAHDQIYSNYTNDKHLKHKKSLAILWIGQNELTHETDWFYSWDPKNERFAANYSSRVTAEAEYLVENGAPLVLVPNIFPKQLAPVTPAYLCSTQTCVDALGQIIQNANTALEKAIAASKHKSKIIYYDVYGFMMHVMKHKDSYGLTVPLTYFCDGSGNNTMWEECTAGTVRWDGAKKFFWMAFYQPTTTVHALIAKDMKASIDKFMANKNT